MKLLTQVIISITILGIGIALFIGLFSILASNGLVLFEFLTMLIVALFFSIFSIMSIKDSDEKAEWELIAKIYEKYC